MCGEITEIIGPSASGKTQVSDGLLIAFTLMFIHA